MGNVGRFFCVALPFILTAASLVSLLIVGLTGIANNNLFMFRVNTTDLTIDRANLQNLLKISTRDVSSDLKWHDARFLNDLKDGNKANGAGSAEGVKTDNITAADLGLGKLYDVHLWGFCYQPQQGDRICSKAEFDWASKAFNTSSVTDLGKTAGVNITLPKEITSSLDAFKAVSKWTQVVVIIAGVALAIELLIGLFTSCSRVVSCITWVVSGLATAAVIGAASMITVLSALVVGAVEASAKFYGVRASFNTSFLAVSWLAAAFALGASLFWLFTICCCKPEHRKSSRKSHGPESEKFIPSGGYAPLHDDHNRFSSQSYGAPRHQPHAGPRSNAAYEPYSHSNV